MSWFKNIQLPNNFFWGVGVVALVSLLVLMSKKLYENSRTDPKTLKNATTLVNQAADLLANSKETTNPLIAFKNATAANVNMTTALSMAKENELERTTKMKVQKLAADIEQQERLTSEKLNQLFPQPGKVAAQSSFQGGYTQFNPMSMRNPSLPIPSGQTTPAMFTLLQ